MLKASFTNMGFVYKLSGINDAIFVSIRGEDDRVVIIKANKQVKMSEN